MAKDEKQAALEAALKKIEKDTERDNYLSAKEALEYGLVDKIITEKGSRI